MSERNSDNGISHTMNDQMVVFMRVVLAFSALLIIYIDPAEPDRYVIATYLCLILYTLYSAVLYIFFRNWILTIYILPYSHWLDVVWYIILITLSSGTSSLFFFFLFFAILNASFGWGFSSGLKVTLISSLSFIIIGFVTSTGGEDFELNRFLLRPVYLTAFGYMIAYWGGHEIKSKRRLALLKEIAVVSNPRFGVDRTIVIVIELLREFYKADECFLIINEGENDEDIFYNSSRSNTVGVGESFSLRSQVIKNIFSLPKNCAVVYTKNKKRQKYYAIDLTEQKVLKQGDKTFDHIAEKLDARSYLSVPIYHRKEIIGRLVIFSQNIKMFEPSDIDFLLQAINQFMPIIENIRLVDHLASNAAEDERKKIAHDIHDSIIQPYIGLQLGVDSILQLIDKHKSLESNDLETKELIENRIRRLKDLTERGISDLRGYIQGLSKPRGYEASLLPAIQRFSDKYTNATGIAVKIKSSDNIQIADRLAAELFQICVEGLSNIRRHTNSQIALISLTTANEKLFLTIENNNGVGKDNKFSPRSISERVKSLGGFIEIKHNGNKTIVWVEIPL